MNIYMKILYASSLSALKIYCREGVVTITLTELLILLAPLLRRHLGEARTTITLRVRARVSDQAWPVTREPAPHITVVE